MSFNQYSQKTNVTFYNSILRYKILYFERKVAKMLSRYPDMYRETESFSLCVLSFVLIIRCLNLSGFALIFLLLNLSLCNFSSIKI